MRRRAEHTQGGLHLPLRNQLQTPRHAPAHSGIDQQLRRGKEAYTQGAG